MCIVSMIGDEFSKRFEPYKEFIITPATQTSATQTFSGALVSKEEFEKLKSEVELMKSLLKKAKLYDEETGQKDCEMEEKVSFIKKIAEAVGVDLEEIFGPKK